MIVETVTEPTKMTEGERQMIAYLLRAEADHNRNRFDSMLQWKLRDLAHRIEWEEVR